MGKKLRDEDLVLNVIINGDSAKKELGELEQSTRELKNSNKNLRAEKEKLKRAGKQESERYKEVSAALKKNTSTVKANEARMTELRKTIGLTGLTMTQLRKRAKELTFLVNNSTPGTAAWKKYRGELNKVEAQMGTVRAKSKGMSLSMSKMASGFNKYTTMITAGLAAITGIALSVKEWIKGMVKLDDELSNIMKTTGLTKQGVRDLNAEFKSLNTRTTRSELRGLAEEAGRLGKKSKQDIMDFVEVANQITVALGDDLGDAKLAVREVGKLTDIYKIGAQYGTGFKDSMSKMGSAINEVSANSNTQADYLIGYLKRLGGLADQTNVTASEVLGYASALDQLGQKQEMAATAQGKIMIDMFTDQAKYAEIANMKVSDFSHLLETDANEAFLKFLEGLNGNNDGMTVMATKLDNLGVDGSRAINVLSALANNTHRVRKEQALANKAMDEGTSLIKEYLTKNNNFAGSVSKLSQYIHSKLINSSFLGWIEKVVGKMAEWVKIPLSETLRKEQSALNVLTLSITDVNTSQENRNILIAKLQKKYPDFLENLNAETVTNKELKTRLEEVNGFYEQKILLQIKDELLGEKKKDRIKLQLEELELIERITDLKIKEQKADKASQAEREISKRTELAKKAMQFTLARGTAQNKLNRVIEEKNGLLKEEADLESKLNEIKKNQPSYFETKSKPKPKVVLGNDSSLEVLSAAQKSFAEQQQQLQNELAKAGFANLKDGIEKTKAIEEQRWREEKTKLEERLITKQKLSEEEVDFNSDLHLLIEEKKQSHLDRIAELEKSDEERKKVERALKSGEKAEMDLLRAETEEETFLAQLDLAQSRYNQEMALADNDRLKKLQAKKKYEDAVDKINEDASKLEIERLNKKQSIVNAQIDIAAQGLSSIRAIVGEETALGKAAFLAEQAFAIGRIWFNTEIANAKAVASSPITFGQPWVGINTASAIIGTASVLAQTLNGFEEGGFTDVVRAQDGKLFRAKKRSKRGFVDKPSILIGENKPEFVVNGDAVENPNIRPFLDMINVAQENGTVHRLNLDSITSSLPSMRGFANGGFTEPIENSELKTSLNPTSDEQMKTVFMKMNASLNALNIILSNPLIAQLSVFDIQDKLIEMEQIRNNR